MAINQSQSTPILHEKESNHHNHSEEAKSFEELELSLPREKWCLSPYLYFYQNFWCPSNALQNVVSVQAHFQAQDTDIVLATKPKSGTTWLKALAFAILNRRSYLASKLGHPLATSNPHQLVPFLEYTTSNTHLLDLSKINPPRLMATHLPYHGLPECVRTTSEPRIVYICRNPFDTIISTLGFKKNLDQDKEEGKVVHLELDKYVDDVCRGVEGFGPHWDHVLGYWNASLENPNKVLFMKYEDIKMDGISEIKRLAQFLGVPFTPIEEESGVADEILNLCSFETLKEMEVNRSGWSVHKVRFNAFFRKGEVGDWKNHFSCPLFERLDEVMQDKFRGSGLTFKLSPK